MNTLSSMQQQHQQQSHGMVLLTRQLRQRRPASLLLRTCLVTLLSLILLSLFSTTSFVNAATTESPPPTSFTKPNPTKSTTLLTPTPTPAPIIPEQCQECYNGPNNTLTPGMTCFKGTQCVPLQYLCDAVSSPTCSSNNSDDDDDDNSSSGSGSGSGSGSVPILCENQLCNPQNFPPLPYEGSGRIDRSFCLEGSFYSLYNPSGSSSTPKYTASCVEESMFLATDGSGGSDDDCRGPWEYFAIGTCFLKTCGPGMGCVMPFICQPFNSTVPGVAGGGAEQGYGICVDPDGSSSSGGGRRGINGGSATPKYSSSEYLLQGLLIGLCTLALGVGLGVGFWRYKRKKQFRSDINEPHQQHRTRRTSSHGVHSRSHSRSSRNSRSRGDGQADMDAEALPPPPPLLPINNSRMSSSDASTKKKSPTWHSFLCGPCFGYRRRRQGPDPHTGSQRIGRSRTAHSASSLNRLSTLELDHHSQHRNRTERMTGRRGDSRARDSIETDTDSQEDSSIHYRRQSHGRTLQPRWRWGHSTQSSSNDNPMMMVMLPRPPSPTATTGGAVLASARMAMTVVLPEFEPPPMYHRQDDGHGLNLPTYGDISNNSGSSSGIDALEQVHATDQDRDRDLEHSLEEGQQQQQQQQQSRAGPPLLSTAAAMDQEPSSISSTRPTTPMPSSQPSTPPDPIQQLQ